MKKILRDKKAISTILAALLMVVIVVVASVMVYAWSTGLLGSLLVRPNVVEGPVTMDTFSYNSNTNVTLFLRNAGTVSVTLTTYYVKDLNTGSQVQSGSTWTSGAIAPGAGAISVFVTINGAPFTFTSGSWDITTISEKGNQFVFRVTR